MLVNNHSINSAFIALVLFIFIAGCLVSAALANTDLVNFNRSSAEADRMRSETDWQMKMNQMGLPYLETEREARSQAQVAQALSDAQLIRAEGERQAKLIAAQGEAEVNRIRESTRLEIARSDQELAQQAGWNNACMTLVNFAGLSICITLVYFGLRYIHIRTEKRLLFQPRQEIAHPVSVDPWQDEHYRWKQRRKAQLLERQLRKVKST